MHQPFTTDVTYEGRKRARNSERLRLWESDLYTVHKWLCHPGEDCEDGCSQYPIRARMELYLSDLED